MAGNIPAVGGPGSYDQPVFLYIVYHSVSQKATLFKKIFSFSIYTIRHLFIAYAATGTLCFTF